MKVLTLANLAQVSGGVAPVYNEKGEIIGDCTGGMGPF